MGFEQLVFIPEIETETPWLQDAKRYNLEDINRLFRSSLIQNVFKYNGIVETNSMPSVTNRGL